MGCPSRGYVSPDGHHLFVGVMNRAQEQAVKTAGARSWGRAPREGRQEEGHATKHKERGKGHSPCLKLSSSHIAPAISLEAMLQRLPRLGRNRSVLVLVSEVAGMFN